MSRTAVAHAEADSVDARKDGEDDEDKKKKSRRPANTAFRQQRLKAWQPILTPKTVLPLFFVVGIIFAPIGGLLLWASAQVEELIIDYSSCDTEAPVGSENADFIPEDRVHTAFKSGQPPRPTWWRTQEDLEINTDVTFDTPVCSLVFDIPNDLGPSVYLYYRLSNFYQNHRRYVKSLSLDQLQGKYVSNATVGDSTCDPLRLDDHGKAYYPCGLIANSLFNDTFSSPVRVGGSGENETYPMTNKGIAWGSDRDLFKPTAYKPHEVLPPPNWAEKYPNNYTEKHPPPNLQEAEEFQVWMRTAGLPTFSKLARRNDNMTMTKGTYQLDIRYYFPVNIYDGSKSIVITTTTVMGGKNPFMGIAYIVVGGICIILGAVFTFAHLIKPRKLGDHTYLTWNNEEPSTATATGRESRFGQS